MRNILIIILLLAATSCATNPPTGPVYDPWEKTNRKIFAFNSALDNKIVAPVARGYRAVVPDPVETGIGNFFSNLDDVNVFVNDVLQGRPEKAGNAATRFAINTVFGIAGIFDISTRIGLPKHYESFGQTLGVWGIGEGPFVVLPLYGPNNLRSSAGLVVESQTTSVPPYLTNDARILFGATALNLVDTRAQLLSAGNVLDTALDPYLLLRDAWVGRHRSATLDLNTRIVPGSANTSERDELDELDELDKLDAEEDTDKTTD